MNMKITWVLLTLLSSALAVSISLKEREAIYRKHGCKDGRQCEVVEIKLSRRHKRSADYPTFSFPLNIFGSEKILNLRRSTGVLVGPNTPVYFAKSTASGIDIRKKYGLVRSNEWHQLYEDKENSATFMLDINSDEPKIKYGYMASDNLEIKQINPYNSQDDNYYLVKPADEIPKFRTANNLGNSKSIPEIVYPEILILVDHSIYLKYTLESMIEHVVEIWNQAAVFYNALQNPQYKLTIAGIVLPQDPYVFKFMTPHLVSDGVRVIDYQASVMGMTNWLIGASVSIPLNTYDILMIMSPYRHGTVELSTVNGLSRMSTVCSNTLYGIPQGGIFYDSTVNNKEAAVIAAHELGHTLGVMHDGWDKSQGPQNTIMAYSANMNCNKWAPESLKEFRQSIEGANYSCMYNEPDLGYDLEIKNPELMRSFSDKNKINGLPIVITDNQIIGLSVKKFVPDQYILIWYDQDQKLIRVTQKIPSDPSILWKGEKRDLVIASPDTQLITLNPSRINPDKWLYFTHYNGWIYVYQYAGMNPPTKSSEVFEILSPNLELIQSDDKPFCFKKMNFDLSRAVLAYINNGYFYVTQKNQLKISDLLDQDWLQKVPDTEPFYINPKFLAPDEYYCFIHYNNIIFIEKMV